MGRLAQWDAKVLSLNPTNRLGWAGLGWAGLGSGTHPYEAPGNLRSVDVIVPQKWPRVSWFEYK